MYEYKNGDYGDIRQNNPEGETVTLSDYRLRYAQYRLEEPLQNLHALYPFITTWDDHETANNAWKDGAGNHDDATEGPWEDRKRVANQAYREWLPFRVQSVRELETQMAENDIDDEGDDRRILQSGFVSSYRKLQYGSLVDIFVVDNRILARDKQPDTITGFDAFLAMYESTYYEEREMLGETQMQWLKNGLSQSKAKWKVIAQPVMVNPIHFLGLVAALPDSWDGYTAARAELLGHIADKHIDNVVILTGDLHATVIADLPKSKTADLSTWKDWLVRWPWVWLWKPYKSIAVEFVVTSVTSANIFDVGLGLESVPLGVELADFLFNTFGICMNPHIRYFDALNHGKSSQYRNPSS